MAKNMIGSSLWAFGLVLLLVVTAGHVDVITCQQGITNLMPCLPFLRATAPSPTAPCCLGVDNLNKMASSTEDRRTLCDCFKKAAPSFGVDYGRAKQLPQLCQIKLPFPIDPSVNCSSIPLTGGMF